MAKSYYEILGVSNNADEATIRNAYRVEIRKYHPDLNPARSKAHKRTRQLNIALEVLTDPIKRKRYDDKLHRLGKEQANAEFEHPGSNPSQSSGTGPEFEFDIGDSESKRRSSATSRRKKSNALRSVLSMVSILMGGFSGVCMAVLLLWVFFRLDPTGLIGIEQPGQVEADTAIIDAETKQLQDELELMKSRLAASVKEIEKLKSKADSSQFEATMKLLMAENVQLKDELTQMELRLKESDQQIAKLKSKSTIATLDSSSAKSDNLDASGDKDLLPVPDQAAQKLKVAEVTEIYKADYEIAKQPTDKTELAKKLISEGNATTDDPVGRFVLFRMARDMSAEQGDLSTALDAIEQIDRDYTIEKSEMQLEAATIAVEDLKKPEELLNVAVLLEPVIDAAIIADRFDHANSMTRLASRCAKKGRDSDMASRFKNKQQEIKEISVAFDEIKAAKELLQANPSDPSSNLAVGKFLCLVKGDWEKGCPMLALGSDEQFKSAALLELQSNPDAVKLGDAWWKVSEKLSGIAQRRAQARAGEWYQRALPSLSGLTKRKAESRLAELPQLQQTKKPIGDMSNSDKPNELDSRTGDSKNNSLRKYGGNALSEKSVALALKWIIKHQLPDGGWSLDHTLGPGDFRNSPNPGTFSEARNAATALAILPLLGAGNTHKTGQYKKQVRMGFEYLMKNAKRGGRGISYLESKGTMYSHGLVSIVFCEAYAMTRDPQLAPFVQGTVWYIEDAQDPIGGGWRYRPREPGDTSVVGWQMMALKSGEITGLNINPRTYQLAEKFLDNVSSSDGAFYGYMSPPSGKSATARTAIGLLCRMYMGWDNDTPGLVEGIAAISEKGPSTSANADMYYNYYVTQAVKHMGGNQWREWNAPMRDFLVKSQSKDGNAAGSWHFGKGHSSEAGGRLYNTSLACMTLEVYYRYPPLYGDKGVPDEQP